MAQAQSASNEVWVLGGGKFGNLAIKTLQRQRAEIRLIVIEQQPETSLPGDIEIICGNAVEWFTEHFTPDAAVHAIIPAVPIHLAAEWLQRRITQNGGAISTINLPQHQLDTLPHPMRLSSCQAALSHADFRCPEHCSEPEEYCSFTKQKRPEPLYQLIEKVTHRPFVPLVIRSHQFAPGVGGFLPDDLWRLYTRATSLFDTPLLVGTACKCHGIIDTFSIHPPSPE